VSCRVDDLRRTWLTDYVWPCVRAMTVYEGRYLLGTSMARPILAKGQVEYAREIGADAVAHGCTGKGNDQVRFELAYQALGPDLEVIAPWRDWDIRSREDALDYADKRGIQVTASRTKIYSRDRNLWHISHEGGALEDPRQRAARRRLDDDRRSAKAPDSHMDAHARLRGRCARRPSTARRCRPKCCSSAQRPRRQTRRRPRRHLREPPRRHEVARRLRDAGRHDHPRGRAHAARADDGARHAALCEKLMPDYADLVYTGRWFHPARERLLDALFADATKHVTGRCGAPLQGHGDRAVAATSPNSLFSEDLATFGQSASFDHADSYGFVKLYGLPGAVAAKPCRGRNS
jgi:argininosuccinate synthase